MYSVNIERALLDVTPSKSMMDVLPLELPKDLAARVMRCYEVVCPLLSDPDKTTFFYLIKRNERKI